MLGFDLEKLLFKKVEVWLIGLLLIFCLAGTILYGAAIRHVVKGNLHLGSVGNFMLEVASIPSDLKAIFREISDEGFPARAFEQRFSGITGFDIKRTNYVNKEAGL